MLNFFQEIDQQVKEIEEELSNKDLEQQDILHYIEKGKIIVEDVKGIQTDVFKINHKLFEKIYPELELKIIT